MQPYNIYETDIHGRVLGMTSSQTWSFSSRKQERRIQREKYHETSFAFKAVAPWYTRDRSRLLKLQSEPDENQPAMRNPPQSEESKQDAGIARLERGSETLLSGRARFIFGSGKTSRGTYNVLSAPTARAPREAPTNDAARAIMRLAGLVTGYIKRWMEFSRYGKYFSELSFYNRYYTTGLYSRHSDRGPYILAPGKNIYAGGPPKKFPMAPSIAFQLCDAVYKYA